MMSKERAQNFHADDAPLTRSELCFWLVENFAASTTQTRGVTHHQYGISALVFRPQTSCCGETSCSVAKWQLLSQASISWLLTENFVSPTEPPNPTSDTEPIDKDMIWAQLLSCRSAGLVKFFLSLASFSNIKRLLAWCTDLFFPLDSIYMVRSWHGVLCSLGACKLSI